MQQCWFTISKIKDSSSYQFKLDKKRCIIDVEVFRDILQICPRLLNQEFEEPPSDEEIVSFVKELGYKGDIGSVAEVLIRSDSQEHKYYRTVRDDSILGSLRFVFKYDEYQVYGALLPEGMTNQQMRDFPAYKTYLAFAIGATTPKKVRKFKKPTSPSKKKTLVVVEDPTEKPAKKPVARRHSTGVQIRDTFGVSILNKKAPTKAERSKGIDLLSESALLEEAHDDDQTDNPRTSDDEEETQEDKYVHTPEDYVPTNDENVYDEEFDRIDGEMYRDVNVELKDTKLEGNQVKDDAQATHKTKVPLPSSSISSDYAAKFLNFDNIPSTDTDIISMMEIKVQHKDPRIQTSPLLTVPISVIPETSTAPATTIPPPIPPFIPLQQQSTPIPIPTTTEATTSTSFIPDSTTLTAIHQRVSDLEKEVKILKDINHDSAILTVVKSEVQSVVQECLGTTLDDTLKRIKMEKLRKQQETKYIITSSDTAELQEIDQKRTLFETMTKTKLFNKNTKHGALYHALMKSILEDEDSMDKGVADRPRVEKKKTSKETEPSKKAKSTGTSKGTTKSQPKSTAKSAQAEETVFETANTQVPQDPGKDMDNTDEPPTVRADRRDWFEKPKRPPTPDPEWNTCKIVDDGPTQKWLSDLAKAENSSKTFNELMSTPIDFNAFAMNRLQISDLTQADLVGPVYNLLKGTYKSYVELEYNMEECYKALNDQLDWINPEGDRYPFDLSKPLPLVIFQGRQVVLANYFFNNDLAYLQGGSTERTYTTSLTKTKAAKYDLPGIEDMVPNLWSPVKVSYNRYALLGTSHWGPKRQRFNGYATKRVSKHDMYSRKRILAMKNVKVNKWYGYDHLEEIEFRRSDQKLYKFMEGDFPRLHLNDIEDMLLLVVQNRLNNLDGEVIMHFAAALLQEKLKDMLNNLEMGYTNVMPRRRWSNLDKKRSRIMVKDIDSQLLERRLMRSLEKFVGGREYGEDLRLLQRII
ncbi:hypothetical protein Tco_0973618 [Tanacetum coccineum]